MLPDSEETSNLPRNQRKNIITTDENYRFIGMARDHDRQALKCVIGKISANPEIKKTEALVTRFPL